MASRTALAPAKVNLFLHVGAAKPNGRHDLDSLVVFSDDRAGDHVTVEVADTLTLDVAGPFSSASGPLPDNLVLRAAEALKTVSGFKGGARITLKKWLPVAAGIGGCGLRHGLQPGACFGTGTIATAPEYPDGPP